MLTPGNQELSRGVRATYQSRIEFLQAKGGTADSYNSAQER